MSEIFKNTAFYKKNKNKKRGNDSKLIKRIFKAMFYCSLGLTSVYYLSSLKPNFRQVKLQEYSNNFKIDSVKISGIKSLSQLYIKNSISPIISEKPVFLNIANDIRNQLLSDPKIDDVEIQIILPNTLLLKIKEKDVAAIWWEKQKLFTIDINGNIIQEIQSITNENKDKLLFFGDPMHSEFKLFLNSIENNNLLTLLNSISFLSNRRWDIFLKNGIVVKLPEENFDHSLKFLNFILKTRSNLDSISEIDLRLFPSKMYLKYKKINKTLEKKKA